MSGARLAFRPEKSSYPPIPLHKEHYLDSSSLKHSYKQCYNSGKMERVPPKQDLLLSLPVPLYRASPRVWNLVSLFWSIYNPTLASRTQKSGGFRGGEAAAGGFIPYFYQSLRFFFFARGEIALRSSGCEGRRGKEDWETGLKPILSCCSKCTANSTIKPKAVNPSYCWMTIRPVNSSLAGSDERIDFWTVCYMFVSKSSVFICGYISLG